MKLYRIRACRSSPAGVVRGSGVQALTVLAMSQVASLLVPLAVSSVSMLTRKKKIGELDVEDVR